jgi:hypothetical protein
MTRALWTPQQITSQNGPPQNSVIDLAMDGSGQLLMTTEGGLVPSEGVIGSRTCRCLSLRYRPRTVCG